MRKRVFLGVHPFLFILVSLLSIYFQNVWETVPTGIFRPFFVLSVVTLLFNFIIVKAVGNREWGGFLTTIFVIVLFFQKSYFIIVSMSLTLVLLVLILYWKISRRRLLTSHVSACLSLAGFALIGLELLLLFHTFKTLPLSYFSSMFTRADSRIIPLSNSNSDPLPDIYYIILDAYPRADVLLDMFHYDNTEFVQYLEQLGFIVPKSLHSNYPRTALSVSSTLDMQYWDTIMPGMDEVIFWWPTKPVIRSSRASSSLKAIGYQSVTFASDWDLTDSPTADIYFKSYPIRLSGYENYFAVTTPIKFFMPLLQSVAPLMSNEVHRHYFINILGGLKKMPDIEGPKFVFAHVLLPHPPFVFNADGSPIESDEEFTFAPRLTTEEKVNGYVEHIEFLNDNLRSIVDSILINSKTPPIIILQADHGSDLYYSFAEPEKSCLKERFSIFGAYYLPGRSKDIIPPDITPVNLFRIIFNEYFGAEMPLLDNHHYATIGHNLFAGLKDVTGSVEIACEIPRN